MINLRVQVPEALAFHPAFSKIRTCSFALGVNLLMNLLGQLHHPCLQHLHLIEFLLLPCFSACFALFSDVSAGMLSDRAVVVAELQSTEWRVTLRKDKYKKTLSSKHIAFRFLFCSVA